MLRYFAYRWLDRRLVPLIPNPLLRVAIIVAVLILAFGRRRARRARRARGAEVYPAPV